MIAGIINWNSEDGSVTLVERLKVLSVSSEDATIEKFPGGAFSVSKTGSPLTKRIIKKYQDTIISLEGDFFPQSIESTADFMHDSYSRYNSLYKNYDGLVGSSWSCSIWDPQKALLSIANDSFGRKSLYYLNYQGMTFFSNSLRRLLRLELFTPSLSLLGIASYFINHMVPPPHTMVNQFKKLGAGEMVAISDGINIGSERYQVPKSSPHKNGFEECKEALLSGFDHYLKNNDGHNFGCFLSGGVDSSVNCTILAKEFHVKFPTYSLVTDYPSLSEESYSRSISKQLDLPNYEIEFKLTYDLVEKLIAELEEPLSVAFSPKYVSLELAKKHNTDVISGSDDDLINIPRIPQKFPNWMYYYIYKYGLHKIPDMLPSVKGISLVKGLLKSLIYDINGFLESTKWITNEERRELFNFATNDKLLDSKVMELLAPAYERGMSPVDYYSKYILALSTFFTQLKKGEWMASLQGVRMYYPFLYEPFVSSVFRLDMRYRENRYFLEAAFGCPENSAAFHRPKVGLGYPWNFLRRSEETRFKEILLEPDIYWDRIFNRQVVERMYYEFVNENKDYGDRLNKIALLKSWCNSQGIEAEFVNDYQAI
ncbi:asparagine synthase-related protein [Chloroflexota bacterium]